MHLPHGSIYPGSRTLKLGFMVSYDSKLERDGEESYSTQFNNAHNFK